MPKAEIYEDVAGQWRWRVKATNGEIVAQGESYTRQPDALRGLKAAQIAYDTVDVLTWPHPPQTPEEADGTA